MKTFQKISDSEQEVMEILWNAKEPLLLSEILKELSAKKNWKPTTVQTFLHRLEEKNLVSTKKNGKVKVYQAALKKNEYQKLEAQNYLERSHAGSITQFITALYSGERISEQDHQELFRWFSKQIEEE